MIGVRRNHGFSAAHRCQVGLAGGQQRRQHLVRRSDGDLQGLGLQRSDRLGQTMGQKPHSVLAVEQ